MPNILISQCNNIDAVLSPRMILTNYVVKILACMEDNYLAISTWIADSHLILAVCLYQGLSSR